MYRHFWHPNVHKQGLAVLSGHRALSMWFGLLVIAVLVIAPVVGRLVIPAKFYRRPFDSYRSDVWYRAPSLFRVDTTDSSISAAVPASTRSGRLDELSSEQREYRIGEWSNQPLRGAILGTDQEGRNVLWRLIHGSEVVIIQGVLSATIGLIFGLFWGLAMSWWSPPGIQV